MEMEKLLEELCLKTNRHKNQTKMLLQLVDNNFEKLCDLEVQIKNNNLFYCPSTKQEVQDILDMKPKNKWFKL